MSQVVKLSAGIELVATGIHMTHQGKETVSTCTNQTIHCESFMIFNCNNQTANSLVFLLKYNFIFRSLCILTADCDQVELCSVEECVHGQKECGIGNEGEK